MYWLLRASAFAIGLAAVASTALAEGYSTSAANPTAAPANGILAGPYPAGDGETTLYFAVDLKAGELSTQSSFLGRPGRDKSLEFDLKDPKGRLVSYYTVMSGLDANQEATRVLPIDSKGRYTVALKLKGPETTSFQVALGGSALPNAAAESEGKPFSRSYLAPTPLPSDGVIAGVFPGGEKRTTYYYLSTHLKPGDLLTQISYAGRANAPKMLELALLDAHARVADSYYIMGESDPKNEKTRAFPIDSKGDYVLRVAVSGVEGARFRIELGGDAVAAK
jgi:hypothetical protein